MALLAIFKVTYSPAPNSLIAGSPGAHSSVPPSSGGPREPDGERGADRHGLRGGPGAAAQLQDLVAGGRLHPQLAEEAASQRRQQPAQAEE